MSSQDMRFEHMEGKVLSARVDLMERLDRQQNSLTDIRNDIRVNAATANSVKQLSDNTRDDLRSLHEVVTHLRLKIDRLEGRVRDITGDP